MKKLSKGVKVTITGTQVDVTLNLVLSYGVSIPKTSQEVQDKVKSAIETMTYFTVSEVNIRIAESRWIMNRLTTKNTRKITEA